MSKNSRPPVTAWFKVGAKTTMALQLSPTPVLAETVQEPPALENPPVPIIVGEGTIAGAVPPFITVKVSGELNWPTATDPKLKASGEIESCGLAAGAGPLKISISVVFGVEFETYAT